MDNNQTTNQPAAGEQQNTQAAAPQQNGALPTPNAEDITNAIIATLGARQPRLEHSIIKAYAQQNNMSVEELTQLVNDHKAQQAEAIPDDVQARIDERMRTADNRLISAEVRAVGTELNIIDIDAAFMLMDKSGVKVGEGGSVTGVKEALEALTAAKPYLVKAAAATSGTGSTGNFPRTGGNVSTDFAARLNEARKSGNHGLATAIISEAAAKGIYLR